MIYRILTGAHRDWWDSAQQTYVRTPLPMMGAGATLSRMMWELHLPPPISNARARFWFTERGWDRFGRALVIVFADEWQMALLPARGDG